MTGNWQTEEVIRWLAEADQNEIAQIIEVAGDEAAGALTEWGQAGNAPKGFYDALRQVGTERFALDWWW